MLRIIYNLLNIKINRYSLGDVFWNLSLIIFAYYLFYTFKYLILQKKTKWRWPLLILVFMAWFAFLPNTLYLLTDIRHLLDYCPRNSYLDMCPQNSWMLFFFFAYAMIGWLSFFHMVNEMYKLLRKHYKRLISEIFLHFTLIIMPLGVLIGLINRFNSWDLINAPGHVLHTVAVYFSDWLYFKQWLVYILVCYLLFYLTKALLYFSQENK